MRVIIMANGEYGDLEPYKKVFKAQDIIICADGGANYAKQLDIVPDMIVGDLDSIEPELQEYFQSMNVEIKKYPRRKDLTDGELTMVLAEEYGANEIILMGSMGKRLDHTLANIYCGMELAQKGKHIMHYSPDCNVHLVTTELELTGKPGDTVSVLTLTDEAKGIWEIGFEYPLQNAYFKKTNPYAISNVLIGEKATIKVKEGVLAVFHYSKIEE